MKRRRITFWIRESLFLKTNIGEKIEQRLYISIMIIQHCCKTLRIVNMHSPSLLRLPSLLPYPSLSPPTSASLTPLSLSSPLPSSFLYLPGREKASATLIPVLRDEWVESALLRDFDEILLPCRGLTPPVCMKENNQNERRGGGEGGEGGREKGEEGRRGSKTYAPS